MKTPRDVTRAVVAGLGMPAGTPTIFWGVCQGAPTGATGSKLISVKVNGSATAISMAYDSGYAAGTAPALNDVVWGWLVGSDYFVVGKRA